MNQASHHSSSNVTDSALGEVQLGSSFQWQSCVDAVTDAKLRELAAWRGYDLDFCRWLRNNSLVGLHSGNWAIPVMDEQGYVFACQARTGNGNWYYEPPSRVRPLVLGNPANSTRLFVYESTWDCFAALAITNALGSGPPETCCVVTRGAGNARLVAGLCRADARVYAFVQNDPVDAQGDSPAEKWLREVAQRAGCPVYRVATPAAHEDFNAWLKAGMTKEDFSAALESAILVPAPSLVTPAMAQEEIAPGAEDGDRFIILPSGEVSLTDCAGKLFPVIARSQELFTRNGIVCELERHSDGVVLSPVPAHAFRSRMEHYGRVFAWRKGSGGQPVLKPTIASVDTAAALLATKEATQLLPGIKCLVNCPVLIGDGDNTRIVAQGYDSTTGIYVTGGTVLHPIAVSEAVAGLKESMSEFDFVTPGDRSRALASLITPAMKFGGYLPGHIPLNVAEANDSQAGKGYMDKLRAAVYNAIPTIMSQRVGGVGSDDEKFDQALLCARPFISFDNRRGKFDSTHLEAFLTAPGLFSARVPYKAAVNVDPRYFVLSLTSNGVEATRDLANRSSIVRIRRRVGYSFKQYPEGDLYDHVRANQGFYLGCVFAVIIAWLQAGRPRTKETGHSFRDWAQTLDWIVQYVLGEARLLDGHEAAQSRVASSGLGFLRKLALTVDQNHSLGRELTCGEIHDLMCEHTVEFPDLVAKDREQGARILGTRLGRLFSDAHKDIARIDDFEVRRTVRSISRQDGKGQFDQKRYVFRRAGSSLATPGNPVATVSPARGITNSGNTGVFQEFKPPTGAYGGPS